MTLSADGLLRRLHVLPAGRSTRLSACFVRIRHFGLLANWGRTATLARCRALLAAEPLPAPAAPEPVATLLLRVTGVDSTRCPVGHLGRLRRSTGLTASFVAVFRPGHLPASALDGS